MALTKCPVCKQIERSLVHSVARIPINYLVADALAERHFASLEIVSCKGCGHVYNATFDADQLDNLYAGGEITNSPVHVTMNKHLEDTADFIQSEAPVEGKVLEIGGGAGAMSRVMAHRMSKVTLCEPNKALSQDMFTEANIRLVQDMFPTPLLTEGFNVIICRQMMEHVLDPGLFLSGIHDRLLPDGLAYIEVPDMAYLDKHAVPIDFHYPHVQYYYQATLNYLFAKAGLEIIRSIDVKGGHDIGYLVRKQENTSPLPLPKPGHVSNDLALRVAERISIGASKLEAIDGPVAAYGICACSEALYGIYSDFDRFGIGLDDTPSYQGHSTYGLDHCLPISQPSIENLKALKAIIITSYMHDKVISAKLLDLGFQGQIFTSRCDGYTGQNGIPESLFIN